jgi:hypothetical protein
MTIENRLVDRVCHLITRPTFTKICERSEEMFPEEDPMAIEHVALLCLCLRTKDRELTDLVLQFRQMVQMEEIENYQAYSEKMRSIYEITNRTIDGNVLQQFVRKGMWLA